MKVNITYPPPQKGKRQRSEIINFAKIPFLTAALICPLVNICTGGKPWSVVVLWSLLILWSHLFSTDIIEYNRISQLIKLITQSCVLLVLIDVLLSPGWAAMVAPIVCFGGLAVAGVLFLTDIERQRHNIRPLLLLAVVSLVSAGICLKLLPDASRWPFIVQGALSLALLVVCICIFGSNIIQELKKIFHTR